MYNSELKVRTLCLVAGSSVLGDLEGKLNEGSEFKMSSSALSASSLALGFHNHRKINCWEQLIIGNSCG